MTYYATTNACLRSFILDYFGERSEGYCGNCSNCLQEFREVDITVEAQKILSCVKRTGERFGRKMICDVLRGRGRQRVHLLGLDEQSTYGIMEDFKEYKIREIMDFLERNGYLEAVGAEYPRLMLGKRAGAVLFGNETLSMKQAKPKEVRLKKTKKAKQAEGTELSLFAELKALRRKLADEMGVPAYVVFSDATLVDMCRVRPESLEEMLLVSGVGRVKLEKYGEQFLQVLALHP